MFQSCFYSQQFNRLFSPLHLSRLIWEVNYKVHPIMKTRLPDVSDKQREIGILIISGKIFLTAPRKITLFEQGSILCNRKAPRMGMAFFQESVLNIS